MACPPSGLTIVVDHRERASGLVQAIGQRWAPVHEGTLAVGDLEVGPRVVVERKTVRDFATSLQDRRLFSQIAALQRVALRPLLILEGTDPLPVLRISPFQLQGVLLTLIVSFRVPVLRTSSVEETASIVARIAAHEARRLHRGAAPPRATRGRQALDVLTSIPGIGDDRARRLLDAFGSVAAIVAASPADLRSVAGIGPHSAAALRAAMGHPAGDRAPDTPRPAPTDPEAGSGCGRPPPGARPPRDVGSASA